MTKLLTGAALALILHATTVQAQDQPILSEDFSTGPGAFFARGEATVAPAEGALLTTGRTANWQGPALDLLPLTEKGAAYDIALRVKLAEGSADGLITVTVQRTPTGGETAWDTVVWQVPATAADWTEITGSYSFATDNSELQLYVESPDAVLEYLIDDVKIVETAPAPAPAGGSDEVISENDFNAGDMTGWGPRGEETLATSADAGRDGSGALLISGRNMPWNGPALDLTGKLEPGRTYGFSLWLKQADGGAAADMRVSLQTDQGGQSAYTTLDGNRSVGPDDWVEFTGEFSVVPGLEGVSLYAEADSALGDFLIDDVRVVAKGAPMIEDIPELKTVFADDFTLGVAIDARETAGTAAELLTRHFGQITPENHMKPEAIQPTEGNFTFERADELLEFAEANGLRVYGHVLVWHSQTPDWFFLGPDGQPLTNSPEDQAIARARMKAHIEAVAAHMKGRVWGFDVVNEVIDESQADGLRRSRWYEILGPEFIADAFRFSREAFGPDVKLFINDYNTEFPAKREAYYTLIKSLVGQGVPIDGVGHQFHGALSRPPALLDDTLTKFTDLGLIQAVTEIDISISASSSESLPETPPDRLITQGYYMQELGDVLRKHADQIEVVTFWGLTDNRSWLKTWPIDRPHEAPLLFDSNFQAKPAFWGLVDPSQLPHLPKTLDVVRAAMSEIEDIEAEWDWLPSMIVGQTDRGRPFGQLKLRWDYETLYVRVRITDTTPEDGDKADFFIGDQQVTVMRSEGREITGGWTADVELTAEGDNALPFDIRLTDASGMTASWSDQSHMQEASAERRGTLMLMDEMARVTVPQAAEAPVIDGEIDAVWDSAIRIDTGVVVEGDGTGATAAIRMLWDKDGVYFLAEVTDPALDAANSNPWEQDSLEIFLSPGNDRFGPYEPNDGQYRVNFENHASVAGDATRIGSYLTSAAKVVDGGYVIEARLAIPSLRPGRIMGADFQVNDATDGVRTSVMTWNDPMGQSYQNTTRWGAIRLGG